MKEGPQSPLAANDLVNYPRFLELSEEFNTFVVSLHALYLDSLVGFATIHRHLLEHQTLIKSIIGKCEEARDEFQDDCLSDYKGLCGPDFPGVRPWPYLQKQGEVRKRTARNGTNYILLGRLCVVCAYAYWEEYLRDEVARAIGARGSTKSEDSDAQKVTKSVFWGDMRNMRQAILHCNGVATAKCEKNTVLKWFKKGDEINLDFDKMKVILDHLVDFKIVLYKLSRPPHNARFPS